MSDFQRDISKATRSLADAIEQFDRGVAKAASKRVIRRRIQRRPLPLRQAAAHRPTRHPISLPVMYRRPQVKTVADRLRARADRLRGGPNPIVAAVRRAAGRVTSSIRRSLQAVRRGMARAGARARRAF